MATHQSSATASDSDSSGRSHALFARRLDLLVSHTPVTLAASSVCALVLTWGLWASPAGHRTLVAWLLAALGTAAARMAVVAAYTRRTANRSLAAWAWRMRIGTLLSGCLWGLVSFLVAPAADNVLAQAFLLLIVGGLLAGSLGAYAVDLPSFGAFVVPVTLPTILHGLFDSSGLAGIGGSMSLVFAAVVSAYALRLNRTFVSTLQLQFDNDQLVRQLDAEKSHLEALKGALEERVVERTAVLEVTNRQLAGEIENSRLLRDKLLHQATHDAVTHLINRREFERRLQSALNGAKVDPDTTHVLCYLDLDQFKIINDTCGHAAGDSLLQQISALLHSKVRRSDSVARLGGDEFGILMEHCSLENATRTAHALLAATKDFRFAWGERSFRVSFSMGVVPIDASSGDLSEVLRHADAACYEAKDQGRGRLHIAPQTADSVVAERRREMGWVERLGRALETGSFQLVYQPIQPIDGRDEGGLRCEILLRLVEPGGQVISPSAFMRSAERYNMAVRIDQWVVEAVLDRLCRHPDRLAGLRECSLNLSGQSVGSHEFQDWLIDAVSAARLPPGMLCFELTETAAMVNLEQGRNLVNRLRDLGCSVALDDFGTGFSSFGYLKTLPVDYLKIDGTLVEDVADDPVAFSMVKSINDIGRLMGKKTVAEYASNEATIRKLREIGVDFAQGFGIGRPRSIDELFTGDAAAPVLN